MRLMQGWGFPWLRLVWLPGGAVQRSVISPIDCLIFLAWPGGTGGVEVCGLSDTDQQGVELIGRKIAADGLS
jgi:ABC-type phosphate transport system auxiliary subunit